jgi:DNA-binding HxlR family transcriptional regulator
MRRSDGVRMVEDVLGCKWTVQILAAIAAGARRPGGLRRSVPGISTKVMNERLQKLVGYAVLERRALSLVPPHVEYHLTAKGRELAALVQGIQGFCARWEPAPGAPSDPAGGEGPPRPAGGGTEGGEGSPRPGGRGAEGGGGPPRSAGRGAEGRSPGERGHRTRRAPRARPTGRLARSR